MNTQATDPRMIDALHGASSLQLYQLKAMIEGMLADPRGSLPARANLHLGQAVRFVDFRDGQMRSGKIFAMRDTQATVLEQGTKRTWKIPCVAMQGYTDAERRAEQAPYEPPPEPVTAATKAREFQRSDTVTFDDRDDRTVTGVIVRINQRTEARGTGDSAIDRFTCCGTCSTSASEPRGQLPTIEKVEKTLTNFDAALAGTLAAVP